MAVVWITMGVLFGDQGAYSQSGLETIFGLRLLPERIHKLELLFMNSPTCIYGQETIKGSVLGYLHSSMFSIFVGVHKRVLKGSVACMSMFVKGSETAFAAFHSPGRSIRQLFECLWPAALTKVDSRPAAAGEKFLASRAGIFNSGACPNGSKCCWEFCCCPFAWGPPRRCGGSFSPPPPWRSGYGCHCWRGRLVGSSFSCSFPNPCGFMSSDMN